MWIRTHEFLEDMVIADLANALEKARRVFGERKSVKAMADDFDELVKAVDHHRAEFG